MDYELINRAIVMDLWSLTEHTKVTRQEFLDALARIQQQAQEREEETFRNPCEHGCPKDEPCPTDCDCTCHTDEPVRYRALRNLLEMKHDRMTRLEGEIARLRAALELAIMTVECASIDIRTGEELPWYRAAKSALTAEAKPEAEDCDHPESPAPVTECGARALLSDFVRHAAPLAAHAGSEWSSVTTIPIDDGELGLSQPCHWLNETSKEAIELFATPCECVGLREENANLLTNDGILYGALGRMQDTVDKLRAELAAANERAERAEAKIEAAEYAIRHCAALKEWGPDESRNHHASRVTFLCNQLDATVHTLGQVVEQRDTAQAGWKEAVEALRVIRKTHKRNVCLKAEHRILRSPLCWICQVDARIEESAATIARFDAQGGVK